MLSAKPAPSNLRSNLQLQAHAPYNESMIKAVLFDFGGVVSETGKHGFIRQLIAELYHRPEADVKIQDLHVALRRGVASEEAFFAELNRRYGGLVTKEQFVIKANALVRLSPEVQELARKLKQHGIKTGLFSNVFDMNARELRRRGVYRGFDPVILSCEEGYVKPEPEIYQIALKRLGMQAKEVLFIDDQEKCLPPAKKLGMHTILATSSQQIVDDTIALLARTNGVIL